MFRFLLLFLLLAVPQFAWAQADDYTVSDIAIDQPTTDPTTARDQALETALKQGYETLRTRRAAQGEQLPAADQVSLWKLMQDFEVSGEKISASRYIGNFTIRFRPRATAAAGAELEAAEVAALGGLQGQSAVFRFNNLMEWQSARNALQRTAGVRRVSVTALRRNQVDVHLEYTGDAQALAGGLSAQGFIVSASPVDTTTWVLGLRR